MNNRAVFGIFRASVWRHCNRSYSVGVIGAPFWNGQSNTGIERAPDELRGGGLLQRLQNIQPNVADFGNLNFDRKLVHRENMLATRQRLKHRNEYLLAEMCTELSDFVGALCDTDFVPLTLGGDRSIAVGTVSGLCRAEKFVNKDISLIWIGAHADVNTEASSETGNLHGMPLSFLLKNLPTLPPKSPLFEDFQPCIDPKNVVFIGLRNVDYAERELLDSLKIRFFSMCDVDRFGVDRVINEAIEYVSQSNPNSPLHLSFDVDSVDSSVIRSTGTALPGGLTLREALRIGEIVHESQRMAALDMVEFNPSIGNSEQVKQDTRAIIEIILAFFGKSRLGDYNSNNEKRNHSYSTSTTAMR